MADILDILPNDWLYLYFYTFLLGNFLFRSGIWALPQPFLMLFHIHWHNMERASTLGWKSQGLVWFLSFWMGKIFYRCSFHGVYNQNYWRNVYRYYYWSFWKSQRKTWIDWRGLKGKLLCMRKINWRNWERKLKF